MTYLNDVTAILLMSFVVTFVIVCSVLVSARKEAREAPKTEAAPIGSDPHRRAKTIACDTSSQAQPPRRAPVTKCLQCAGRTRDSLTTFQRQHQCVA
jgi:hypothetical protein